MVYPTGPRTRARVAPESWSTSRAIGPEPESPGKAGLPHGPSDLSASCPVQLVDIAGLRHGPETPGRAVRHRRHWNTAPGPTRHVVEPAGHRSLARVLQDSWSTLQAIGPKPDCPGELVNPVDPRNRARVAKECWSTPRPLGPEREAPGRVGLTCGSSDPSPSRTGRLVDPVEHRT